MTLGSSAAWRGRQGALVVTVHAPEGEHAAGVLTDRDLAIEVLARELDAGDMPAGQIARRELASVPGDAGIAEAVAEMQKAGVRRLLVTGQHGELSGIVSADDLLEALAAQLAGLSTALRQGIARETSQRPSIAPKQPRPVFLPYGTPGMRQPIGR